MIIIERKYVECYYSSGMGETRTPKIDREAFSDDDIAGVNAFIKRRCSQDNITWKEISFNYIKL